MLANMDEMDLQKGNFSYAEILDGMEGIRRIYLI
jgi:hypothetical protein